MRHSLWVHVVFRNISHRVEVHPQCITESNQHNQMDNGQYQPNVVSVRGQVDDPHEQRKEGEWSGRKPPQYPQLLVTKDTQQGPDGDYSVNDLCDEDKDQDRIRFIIWNLKLTKYKTKSLKVTKLLSKINRFILTGEVVIVVR